MTELQAGWMVKGVFNETCAQEGTCPIWYGQGVQNGCRSFMVFRIKEGKVNGVDLSGITIIYVGDIPHSSFAEIMTKGSEGGIYISNNATTQQREVLNGLAVQSLGGLLMRKVLGLEYVEMDVREENGSIYFKMPHGEMKQNLTTGGDGKNPARIENQILPMLTDVKACHTPFWRYQDHNLKFDYENRGGMWANFVFGG